MERLFVKSFLLLCLFFIGSYIYAYSTPQYFSKACAAQFNCAGAPACPNPNYGGQYGSACIDSVNLSGKIRVRGLGSAGEVSVAANVRGFELDNNYQCSDVICLLREAQSSAIPVYPGNFSGNQANGVTFDSSDGSYLVPWTVNTIGCSGDPNCNDWFSLTAVVKNQGNYTCTRADDQTLILKGLNGQSPPLGEVSVNCVPKNVPTPVCVTYCEGSQKCDATHYKTIEKCSTEGNPADPNVPGTFRELPCGTQAQYHDGLTNTCQALPTPSPTKTPTPSPTKTPTPTPTKTPTPTPTPSPSACPVPSVVPNVRIDCPTCQ